jgi:hypothetical protein
MKKRNQYSFAFKAKVVIEVFREEATALMEVLENEQKIRRTILDVSSFKQAL